MLVAFNRFQFQLECVLVLFEAVWALLRFRDVPPVALNLRPRVRLAFFYQMTSCLQLRQALGSSAMRPVVRGHYGWFAIGKRIAGNLLWKTC